MSSAKTVIPIKAIDFDQAERAVDTFSKIRNVPSAVFPQDEPAREGEGAATAPIPPKAAQLSTRTRKPWRKFTVDLPDYVIDAIQAKAFNSRPKRTARHIVMSGLRAVGIEIHDEDMPEDGRRSRAAPNT